MGREGGLTYLPTSGDVGIEEEEDDALVPSPSLS